MNTMRWLNTGALIGTLIFTPAVLLGVQACQPETTARATNSENFSGSASGLLKDIREDAQRVHYHARVIEDFTNSQEADWEAHAHELRRIKAEVDDMWAGGCAGWRLTQAQPLLGSSRPSIKQLRWCSFWRTTPTMRSILSTPTKGISGRLATNKTLKIYPPRQARSLKASVTIRLCRRQRIRI